LKKVLPFQIRSRTAVMRTASTIASRRALSSPELPGLGPLLDMARC
jgi:hypothetical protein